MSININNKIKLIENLKKITYWSKQLINKTAYNSKKLYIETKYDHCKLIFIYALKKIITNINYILYICYNFKKYIKYTFKFTKFLFIYFVEKYYYKTNNINFIIKTIIIKIFLIFYKFK